MRVNFHKGYPHGSAVLEMVNDEDSDTFDKVWSGKFWNGVVVEDEGVDDDIRSSCLDYTIDLLFNILEHTVFDIKLTKV